MKGSYVASGQHGGIDFNAASLTGKRTIQRRLTVETSGTGKRRRVVMKSKAGPRDALNMSNTRDEEPVYDKQLLANMGPQRLTSLSMKAGTRLGHIDRYAPFLKNLQQNGRISMAFNGTLKTTTLDKRHVSMQVFRHSYSKDSANLVNDGYPETATHEPHILYPASQEALNLGYTPNLTNTPSTGDTVKNPFYLHSQGQVSFAPLNLPDMEDMSWNLNKLKLSASDLNPNVAVVVTGDCPAGGGALTNGTIESSPAPNWDINVPNYRLNSHRRQSVIRQNNFLAISTAELDPEPTVSSATKASNYLYDACIRYGTLQYEFMNKQDTGATVEIILYKIKKTQCLLSSAVSYQSDHTLDQNSGTEKAYYPLNFLVNACSKGYIDTVGQDYSTENFTGRKPDYLDIYDNPNYPLLPSKLKKTVQGDLPFSEVMRNKFAMSAGSRRNLTINLPGLLYNPAGKPAPPFTASDIGDTQLPYSSVPICDNDTYCVVLSCNGQKMTRFFDNQPKSAVPDTVFATYRVNWWDSNATGQQGSGLDPTSAPAPNDQVPYMWAADYDATSQYSVDSGQTQTFTITYLNTLNVFEDSGSTVDVFFADYTGSVTPPNTSFNRVCTFSNFVTNGDPLSWNVQYNIRNLASFVEQNWLTPAPSFAASFMLNSFGSSTVVGKAAVLPEEMAMGDNHGLAHIDYCATYTEHIGACVYKERKERNLYDCGNPIPPKLTPSATSGSVESSRMILPAVNVVRQAKRVGYSIDSSGNPDAMNVQTATDNN